MREISLTTPVLTQRGANGKERSPGFRFGCGVPGRLRDAAEAAGRHNCTAAGASRCQWKIAIARFSNSTNYGRALLLDGERDRLADQASDMLMARLVDSSKFLVFERDDLDAIKKEQALNPGTASQVVGVDTLIVGSITEFGRKTDGQVGFLSSTLRQTVAATVEIRLVDVRTGQAFFTTRGAGNAVVEAGEVAGFGARAAYDATLNDQAISAAISDLINNVVQRLEERPWFTDILQVNGNTVLVSGGPKQGIKVGDQFRVDRPGATFISQQTGLPITAPGEAIAQIQIVSFFGEGDGEGASARIVNGNVPPAEIRSLVVKEVR
jgi:curli biogenesis system outer membrane secretion channel CsgG